MVQAVPILFLHDAWYDVLLVTGREGAETRMFMIRRASIVHFPVWSLLFAWLFFGCVELAEQVYGETEAAVEEQAEQDLDQEALSLLASGLKPDVPSLDAPGCASCAATDAEFPFRLSADPLHQREQRWGHNPPSLRLHQQLSVYRI